ncbi:MAG: FAD-dependent oxidoreductase [Erysipelotrichaceae bacterium]|nr:FAD-dependent oxidoreductase [Erysipelotrichaceae bacterium]
MKTTIKEINNIAEDNYIIRLDVPENYHWIPGQFLKISLPNLTKDSRIFSIASNEDENEILMATKSRGQDISDFKKLLFSLTKTDEVEISPAAGRFNLRDDTTPIIMYASGIGITPIFALLKAIKSNQKVEVVYASYGYYVFQEEIDAIVKEKQNITVTYTREIDETTQKLEDLCRQYGNSAYYYTSGSPVVIKTVEGNYMNWGIDKDRLVSDSFVGY